MKAVTCNSFYVFIKINNSEIENPDKGFNG